MKIEIGGKVFYLSERSYIVGVINLSPESYVKGSIASGPGQAERRAVAMALDGADIIEVGAQPTKRGSRQLTTQEELEHVIPVVERLAQRFIVSVDTLNPEVAGKALGSGAAMINDITACSDRRMAEAIREHDAAVVVMHMHGDAFSYGQMRYGDNFGLIYRFLGEKLGELNGMGVSKVIIDPGFGFHKGTSLEILRRFDEFRKLHAAILVGISGKNFVNRITHEGPSELSGMLAATAIAIAKGANFIRAHDVKQNKLAAMVADRIMRA